MAPERTTALARSLPSRSGKADQDFDELVQIALDVAGSLEPREVISRILERAVRALQADRATLSSLVDSAVIVEATTGRAGSVTWIGQQYSMDYFDGQPIVKKAVDTLQPTFGGQLATETAAPEFRAALADVKHVAVLPLVHGGKAVGMLVLSRYQDIPFGPQDLPRLTLIGAISGLALRNARLYEEVEVARNRADDTAARLRFAVEAAEQVAGQTRLEEVLIHLLEGAASAVGADGASLARVEGSDLIIESSISGQGIGARWPIAPKVLAGVRQGRPVELPANEYAGTPEGLESILQPYARFLVAPLMAGGETIGLLAMGRKAKTPFDPVAIQSLQQFSALGALLLRNARLIAQAQEAERAKSEFMSFAVHELRGPLTVSGGYLSMALEGGFGDLPKQLKDVLAVAQRKNEEAKSLADELLTVARMEGNVLKPASDRFSMTTHVNEAIIRARPRAELAHGKIEADIAEGLDVIGDEALVGKILNNLLNNALTYVDVPPMVRVAAHRENGNVIVEVADNGIGITDEDKGRIFKRFARGTDRRVIEKAGTGLGLYLSRGLATQMAGSLRLEKTEPGKGSTFVLQLPAAA
jgi:signal transduction histidine kinase